MPKQPVQSNADAPEHPAYGIKIMTFFWEKEHLVSDEQFRRVQHIRDTLADEMCCDRGLAMQLVLTELSEAELAVLERLVRRCQEVRQCEQDQSNLAPLTLLPLV